MRFVHFARSFSLSLIAPGMACHSSSGGSSGPTTPQGAVARFDLTSNPTPNFLDVPFPSDVYLQNGQVTTIPGMDALAKENTQFLTHELAKLDGFSRIAMAMFYVDDTTLPAADDGTASSATLDATTFPVGEAACTADASSMFLLDLDATDPTQAR